MAVVGAIGLAASLAQTVFTALQTQDLKDMCSMFLYETDLEKLKDTMEHVNALFRDVDANNRQGLTNTSQIWIEKLKDAVYDVDDLLDKCRTIGELRKDANFGTKVGSFFSKYLFAKKVSREIKMLRKKLDDITKDHRDFGSTSVINPVVSTDVVTQPAVARRETCSKVSEIEVIGREKDKETIVGMLLSNGPHSDQKVSFVNIVGIGGLGKTTLAQLVYNDQRVIQAFSHRIWVCVSEDSKTFNLQQILNNILEDPQARSLEAAHKEVQERLRGKRYLLVLDDVWIENPEEWSRLKPFLDSDVPGSKIIVTTRSKNVATSIRHYSDLHELTGLSEENSWRLFKLMAFGNKEEDQVDPNLVIIGKEIVKRCANVPLSIRVIASMLYGQGKDKWDSFRSINFADMSDEEYEKSIMQTLMFSYYQLRPQLKSCFSFCSLFPKDHIMRKKLLINLWSAQGYLVATNNAESIEDVGEYYITILLNRCFFQDVELDTHGDVVSFKMHDLMHDLALKVAGNESLITTPNGPNDLGKKVRHLSRDRGSSILCLSNKLRTYYVRSSNDDNDYFFWELYGEDSSSNEVTPIVSKCKHLRVLSLRKFGIGCSLPDKFGNLFHLRYLDLTNNRLEMLPKSITKLHNLQTLILRHCRDLKKLPDDIGKLVNMRTLDINHCKNLNELSDDIGKLVNLRTLDINHCENLNELPDDIGKLVNLRTLDISGCKKLKELPDNIGKLVNLRTFDLSDTKLKELPDDIGKLVNLRTFDISCCFFLKELPGDMSKLVNLRTLDISYCNKLTYMPRGVENLTNLERLSDFIVGGIDVKQIEGSQLVDLQALINLKGNLRIKIRKFSSHNMPRATNRGFILKNAHLKSLTIECDLFNILGDDYGNEFDQSEVHETLVEDLCPNEDIGEIIIRGYRGTKMPSWAASLMEYSDMNGVKMPSRFGCLKRLVLHDLPNVEYIMEMEIDGAWESSCRLFFPVIEELEVMKMPKLKGWWRGLRRREMEGVAGGGCLVDDNGLEHPVVGLLCFPQLRVRTLEEHDIVSPMSTCESGAAHESE